MFTEKEWAMIGDKFAGDQKVAYVFANRALSFDFRNPCEHTYVHWSSIVQLIRNPDSFLEPNIAQSEYFKGLFKSQQHTSRNLRPKVNLMDPLPGSPEEFLHNFPAKFRIAYPGFNSDDPLVAGPIPNKIDDAHLEHLRKYLPKRGTHSALNTRGHKSTQAVQAQYMSQIAHARYQSIENELLPGFTDLRGRLPRPLNYDEPPAAVHIPQTGQMVPFGHIVPYQPALTHASSHALTIQDLTSPLTDKKDSLSDMSSASEPQALNKHTLDMYLKKGIHPDLCAAAAVDAGAPAPQQGAVMTPAAAAMFTALSGPAVPAKKRKADAEDAEDKKKVAVATKDKKAYEFSKKFPGVPKKKMPPQQFGDFKIYTSISANAWRALRAGEKVDKAFSWKTKKPAEAWKELMKHIGSI